ncbi:MAG: CHRD domain-containing protein [Deltaproteobacteria bacterium]
MNATRRITCFVILAIASAGLSACGGGGGGGGSVASPTPQAPASTIITKVAGLDNAQETTGSTSTGVGGGVLSVDTATGGVTGFVVGTGVIGATQAHVHTGARGVAGPITVPLAGGPDLWFVPDDAAPLAAADIAAFEAGNMYFNIHNADFPGGAIRGQLDITPTAVELAALDNTQETTGSNSTGVGGGILGVDTATGRVGGFAVSTGVIGATQAHVHTGARGVAGPITVPLVGGPDLWFVPDGAAALAAADISAFTAGNMYFNIHNADFAGGAIRGQLDKGPTAFRFAFLDNTQETTGSTSTGVGGGILGVDTATGKVAGFAVSAGVIGATQAHVHTGARGVAGPITVPLVGGPDSWFVPDGAASLAAADITAFDAGNMYFNIHNADFAGGAIRGQLDHP